MSVMSIISKAIKRLPFNAFSVGFTPHGEGVFVREYYNTRCNKRRNFVTKREYTKYYVFYHPSYH